MPMKIRERFNWRNNSKISKIFNQRFKNAASKSKMSVGNTIIQNCKYHPIQVNALRK